MRKIIQIAKTFIILFSRDKANVFFTFFFNAFLMIMLGWMVQSRTEINMTIGIYDELNSDFSNGFIATLSTVDQFNIQPYLDISSMEEDVKNGALTLAICIKPVFESIKNTNISTPHSPEPLLILYGNSSRTMWLEMMNTTIKTGLLSINESTKDIIDSIHIENNYLQTRDLSYFAYMFPGVLLFTIMGLAFSGCTTLLYYREKDTLKRLKITPLSKSEFLIGFVLSYFVFLVIQTIFYLIIGWLFFGYTFKENYIQVAVLIISTGVLFMALGLAIINISKSSDVGNNIIRFLNFPASFLCGVFIPFDAMPKTMQIISYFHPLTYLVKAIQGVANLSWGFFDNIVNYLVILLVIVVSSILAIKTFVWEEQSA